LDGSLTDHRALGFANSTTDTQLAIYNRNLGFCFLLSSSVAMKRDRFFRKGAHFLTNDAIPLAGPGDAEILVDVR
jgi:hypothetical protein